MYVSFLEFPDVKLSASEIIPGASGQKSDFASQKTAFIAWGEDNLYPQFILKLCRTNAVAARVIKVYRNLIVSTGVKLKGVGGGEPSSLAAAFMHKIKADSLADAFAFDTIVFNGLAAKVQCDLTGKVIGVNYEWVANIRKSKKEDVLYVAKDWARIKNDLQLKDKKLAGLGFEPDEFFPFGEKDATGLPRLKSLYFDYVDDPSYIYYPATTLEPIELQLQAMQSVNEFHKHYAENSYVSAMHIDIAADPTDDGDADTRKARDKELTQQMAKAVKGTVNAGKPLVTITEIDGTGVAGRKAVEVSALPMDNNDKRYDTAYRNMRQDVIIAMGVVAPEAFGINTGSGFSSKAETITTALNLAQEYEVKPKQAMIADFFNKILKMNGFTETAYFENKTFFADDTAEVTNTTESQTNE